MNIFTLSCTKKRDVASHLFKLLTECMNNTNNKITVATFQNSFLKQRQAVKQKKSDSILLILFLCLLNWY